MKDLERAARPPSLLFRIARLRPHFLALEHYKIAVATKPTIRGHAIGMLGDRIGFRVGFFAAWFRERRYVGRT